MCSFAGFWQVHNPTEHYLYLRKFPHAPSQSYLHFWDWYMEAPMEKEKDSKYFKNKWNKTTIV